MKREIKELLERVEKLLAKSREVDSQRKVMERTTSAKAEAMGKKDFGIALALEKLEEKENKRLSELMDEAEKI